MNIAVKVNSIGHVPDAELAVCYALRRGPKTVRQIIGSSYDGSNEDRSTFVAREQLLKRLEKKGIVSVDRTQKPHQWYLNAPIKVLEEQLGRVIDLIRVIYGETIANIAWRKLVTAFLEMKSADDELTTRNGKPKGKRG